MTNHPSDCSTPGTCGVCQMCQRRHVAALWTAEERRDAVSRSAGLYGRTPFGLSVEKADFTIGVLVDTLKDSLRALKVSGAGHDIECSREVDAPECLWLRIHCLLAAMHEEA